MYVPSGRAWNNWTRAGFSFTQEEKWSAGPGPTSSFGRYVDPLPISSVLGRWLDACAFLFVSVMLRLVWADGYLGEKGQPKPGPDSIRGQLTHKQQIGTHTQEKIQLSYIMLTIELCLYVCLCFGLFGAPRELVGTRTGSNVYQTRHRPDQTQTRHKPDTTDTTRHNQEKLCGNTREEEECHLVT